MPVPLKGSVRRFANTTWAATGAGRAEIYKAAAVISISAFLLSWSTEPYGKTIQKEGGDQWGFYKRRRKRAAILVPSRLALGLILILFVIVAYTPVWRAGFIWDDAVVLTANPCIVGPLGLKEIWTTSAADICPLTLTLFG